MAEPGMRDVLERVVSGDDLNTDEARGVMDRMMDGAVAPAVIGAFLAALRTKVRLSMSSPAWCFPCVSMPCASMFLTARLTHAAPAEMP